MRLKTFLTLTLLFLYAVTGRAQGYKIKTIVIDAGHGGVKSGAEGSFSLEKNVALQVALKLEKKLEEELPGIKIIQTRRTDVDVDWYRRAQIANDAKADLFISIHCNSMPDDKVLTGYVKNSKGLKVPQYKTVKNKTTKGTETFVGAYRRINEMDAGLRENEEIIKEKDYKKKGTYDPTDPEELIMLSLYKSLYRTKSLALAKLVQNNYTTLNKRVNRGVKEQGLLILQRAAMPSILTEIGFISNPEEEEYINSATGQEEIITAIFKAIKQYKKEIEN
ncbi:N-acetylmuramoyl-L-alanine amidase [Pedobacter sp. Hv1]|uniref:N-acetylmuramoyl-L-alanine amidase family protein n=1 Tax=Pedobacter sp. Hv1 TaxID=1740090 RepID=UPI0006D8AC24|nr:N-acetylmuramoyl-L-alanine amidase [Pedobacter sp. Hv1]KQC01075.1 N-acetylmuramoyl-L-alanine amidase [Pedobacter sp. Hv1]